MIRKKMLNLDLEYQAALIPLSKAAERQTKTRNMVQQNLGQPYFINDIQ